MASNVKNKYLLLNSFAQETSAHGLFRLSQGKAWQRCLWLCVVLGALIGFSIHLSSLVTRYLQYPVNTEFKESTQATKFPSVTICPTNFLSSYSEDFIPSTWPRFPVERVGLQQMIYNVPRAWHLFRNATDTHHLPRYPYSSYYAGRLSIRPLAYRTKQFLEPHEVILDCKFNHRECSYKNFTIYKDPVYFSCYKFTADDREREVFGSGDGTGLHVVLLSSSEKSFLTEEEEVDYVGGFIAVVHEPGSVPDFSTAFHIQNSKKVTGLLDVSIRTQVNRITSPCKEQWENASYVADWSKETPEIQTFYGSKFDCMLQEQQKEVVSECHCFADHIHVPSHLFHGVPACHHLHEKIFYRYMDASSIPAEIDGVLVHTAVTYRIVGKEGRFTNLDYFLFEENAKEFNGTRERVQCFDRVDTRHKKFGVKHACEQECNKTSYTVTTSNVDWPTGLQEAKVSVTKFLSILLNEYKADNITSKVIEENKTKVLERVESNIAVLNLYLKSAHSTRMTEDWAYPIRNLFSDLGGILGLWIGVSVITVMEFIQLSIQLFYLVIPCSKKQKEFNEPKDVEKDSKVGSERQDQGISTNDIGLKSTEVNPSIDFSSTYL